MYSVLIVEDDESYGELLEFGLTESGYQIKLVTSAKEGLTLLSQFKFNLIICDVLMPEMDGLEFLLEVKKLNLSLKIIMMSGGGITKNKLYLDNSTAMGCDAVIEKPFTVQELEKLIKSVL